jgi:hypothetical protein
LNQIQSAIAAVTNTSPIANVVSRRLTPRLLSIRSSIERWCAACAALSALTVSSRAFS